jgi:hypothetical protein
MSSLTGLPFLGFPVPRVLSEMILKDALVSINFVDI